MKLICYNTYMDLQSVYTHGVNISHDGGVGLGLHHIRYMEPAKMQEILSHARKADEFGHKFSMMIDGQNKNYTIKHTGTDQYKLIPRDN